MTDRSFDTAGIDAIPQVDRLEQDLTVESDEPLTTGESGLSLADREAAEADVLEQAIVVPIDDDYDRVGEPD
ncbi:MAG: hypothetical protein J2P18_10765 [Nocardia sp.]|nr:hypothetical protein [Nocardia sp.]